MRQQVWRAIGFSVTIATLIGLAAGRSAIKPAIGAEPPYNCLARERFSSKNQEWCSSASSDLSARLQTIQTATLIVPTTLESDSEYTSITLAGGRYQREDGKLFVELANDPNWIAFGDINGDGKTDAAVIFGVAADREGRALGTYLTAFLDIDGTAQPIIPIKLGDRILLNGPLAIQPDRIVVPFLTQTEAFDRIYEMNLTLQEVPAP